MQREINNRMYGPSSYYIATQLSCLITNMIYPVIFSSCSFWFFGFPDNSFAHFKLYLGIIILVAMCGATFGFMLGTFINELVVALTILAPSLMLILLVSGISVIIGPESPFYL